MNNDYELNRHKKSDAVKWIVAFALIAVLLIGMSASIILAANNGKDNPSGKDESTEETIADATDDEIYPMPRAMSFTANTLAAALAEGQTVDVKIKAIVSPYDAANQFVDYSVAWGSAPEHGDEPVTDYVTVTPIRTAALRRRSPASRRSARIKSSSRSRRATAGLRRTAPFRLSAWRAE